MKKFKVLALILMLLMVAPLIVACTPPDLNTDNALVCVTSSFPKKLNPYNGSNSETFVLERLYEPLFDWDKEASNYGQGCIGNTVDVSTVGTDQTVTITIKDNVKWNDGEKLTTDDVKFTFDFLTKIAVDRQGNRTFPIFANFVDEAIDTSDDGYFTKVSDTVFKLKLKEKSTASLRSMLTAVLIVPEHIWANETNYTTPNKENPVGSGAYKLISISESMIRLEKVDTYHTPELYTPEQIIVKQEAQAQKAIMSLQDGTADVYLDAISATDAKVLDQGDASDVKVYNVPATSVYSLMLNTRVFESPVVRQAISLSIDQASLIETALEGYGKEAGPCATMDEALTGGENAPANPYAEGKKINEAVEMDREKALQMLKDYFAAGGTVWRPKNINDISGSDISAKMTEVSYTYNEQTGYFEDAQGNRFTVYVWTKVDGVGNTQLIKDEIFRALKTIGIEGQTKAFGNSSVSDSTMKPGGTYAYFDMYLWNIVVDNTNFSSTFQYQFGMDYENGTAVIPDSSFNYGFFDASLYTEENVEAWYGDSISAELKAEYVKIGQLSAKLEALRKALSTNEQIAIAQEIEQLICGTYYKIPLYSANYLYAYSTKKWTGWVEVDNEPMINTATFKNLTLKSAA